MLGKRVREEEKKEERKTARTIRAMLNEARTARGSPHEMTKLAEMMTSRAHNQLDLGYIRTLLFPELYNADVPQPMSTQSYCRFTDKKELSISSSFLQGTNTTASQNAILLWYPKTVIGPQLFIRYGDVDAPRSLSLPLAAEINNGTWKYAATQDYSPYFTQANMVSASISIQYIGQLQLEQGYMVGSQLYGVSPSIITSDDIENGQFRTMCKPGDGLRMTYLPKDLADFQYYPIQKTSIEVLAKNIGNRPAGETIKLLGANAIASNSGNFNALSGQTWPYFNAAPCNVTYYTDGDCIAIYWKGLNPPLSTSGTVTSITNDLRIDIVRKFNGFPVATQRDILDLTKPKKIFDPKKTMDVVTELQNAIPSLLSHSLKSMDRVSDQIQEFLPNIGHLYDEGMLKEGTSLEGFATQLQQISGNEGFSTSFPGRLYES